MTDQFWWYVARSAGMVAWGLLAASVLWGLALSTRALAPRARPGWLLDLHRFLGGLALVFTGVHVAALVLDNYIAFGVKEILVPFTSDYRASAVAWGVVSLYLLFAVEITSLLRSRLPRKVWRRTHVLAFPLYAMSTVHGLLAGADSSGRLFTTAMVASLVGVAALTGLRIAQLAGKPSARPSAAVPS